MKYPIGTRVKVVQAADDTIDELCMGCEGTVVGHNDNGMTGNTETDPLHDVKIDMNTVPTDHPQYKADAYRIGTFWYEELEVVAPDNVQ